MKALFNSPAYIHSLDTQEDVETNYLAGAWACTRFRLLDSSSANCSSLRHDRGKGIPVYVCDKGMRGKGRGLEIHTPAYPCTLTKGLGVC